MTPRAYFLLGILISLIVVLLFEGELVIPTAGLVFFMGLALWYSEDARETLVKLSEQLGEGAK